MGKSIVEIKSETRDQSSSEEEFSNGGESSDEEIKQEQNATDSEESSDEERDGNGKRSYADIKEETEEEERPKKTVKVELPTKKKTFGEEGQTVWVGQLNFDATKDQIREHFSQCGEVVDVRLRTDADTGRSRGFAYVDFKTEEGKNAALKLNATDFMGRTLKIDAAKPATPRSLDQNYSSKSKIVFVANLAHSIDEDGVRQVFEKFGTIVGDIRLPWNRETGKIRGFGYVEFETEDEAEAAVKGLNGVVVEGRPIRTDFGGHEDSDEKDRISNRPAFGFGRRGRGGPSDGGRGGHFNGGRGGRGGRGRGGARGRGDRGGARGRGGRGRGRD